MVLTKLKIGLPLVLLLVVNLVQAQTFAEWWSQKKTQRKYLLQQIAALQVYMGYLKKGYDIADDGLKTVKSFTGGEFDLHSAFITSLKAVNPEVRNNPKVTAIITTQAEIRKRFSGLGNSEWLTPADRAYVSKVSDKVLSEAAADLDELLLVITAGKVEMTDDERLQRLEKVYLSTQEKASFAQSFTTSVQKLIGQRKAEQDEIEKIRRYYESN